MVFYDKYKLSLEENLFIAKKSLITNIYSGARVEGLNVTFPETQAIIDGINVASLTIDDILVIHNLKAAWKFSLNNISQDLSLDFILKINGEVSRNESLAWGTLRTGNVGIGGTDYIPEVPTKEEVEHNLFKILNSNVCNTEKALDLYLYCCRAQLFWDGNKRTAFILANTFLIQHGCGLMTIKDEDIVEFNMKLSRFYSNAEDLAIKEFLFDKCINSCSLQESKLYK